MSYTIGSYQFTKANTDFVETKSDAEMKAQEAHARILQGVEEINTNLSNGTLDLDSVINRIDGVVNEARTQLGQEGVLKEQVLKDGSNGIFLERLDIEVDVEGSNKRWVRTFTISTIADVFRYSAVTPGDLILNGASYLQGDVQVGSDLFIDDHGYFTSGYRKYWVQSFYPGIEGDLRVVGNYYQKSQDRRTHKFNPTSENLNRYFNIAPRAISDTTTIEPLQVERLINEKRHNDIRHGSGFYEVSGNKSMDGTYSQDLAIRDYYDCGFYRERRCWDPASLEIKNSQDAHVKGDLLVEGDLKVYGSLKVDGSIYIEGEAELEGDIRLDNNQFIYIDGETEIDNLNFNGSMYIDDYLYINGDVNTNGTIYTRSGGRVEGMENDSGTIVVLSEGPLTIANNNLYTEPDSPDLQEMNAFFYTNSDLEMFGVGSNLVINGGIYGENIVMNAVKGKTRKGGYYYNSHFRVYDLWFERGQDDLSIHQSRFQINYKEELILNPPEGIPTIEKITVKEIDSHYYEN
ncbi:polymer-forming cytoskeletal protein [Halobacillus sp. H74]|uniref:polymer-forming cytoskeletal protein n=1 Tax=Halobacillus sp. H74 TaxID=3457436 RepID=UPI003FCC8072